jgi:hypothetical protein
MINMLQNFFCSLSLKKIKENRSELMHTTLIGLTIYRTNVTQTKNNISLQYTFANIYILKPDICITIIHLCFFER